MGMFKNFGTGFNAYGKAFSILFSKGFWGYLFIPIGINLLLILGGIYGIGEVTNMASDWVDNALKMEGDTFMGTESLKPVGDFISGVAGTVVWVVLKIALWLFFAIFGGYVVIILMSPVFALLSEKTEERLTGNVYPFNGDQLMRDVARGVMIAMRNLCIEIGWMIAIFILSFFIPVLGGIIGTIILFIIASYFYGFAFIDYTNERRRLSVKESVAFMRKNKGMAIAVGMIFSFCLMIPFCGTFLAGFAAILSVIAATIATHNVVDLSNNSYAKKKNEEEVEDAVIVLDEDIKAIDENTEELGDDKED
jgi:CysZ protein